MKYLVMAVVSALVLLLVAFLVYENAGKKHQAQLKPAAQAQEGAKGAIVEFRTIRYEPNSGSSAPASRPPRLKAGHYARYHDVCSWEQPL